MGPIRCKQGQIIDQVGTDALLHAARLVEAQHPVEGQHPVEEEHPLTGVEVWVGVTDARMLTNRLL